MAKLITPLKKRFGPVTPGERRFAQRLEALLEDDYLCWFDVPIGPKRLHPDFVILHPSRGLLVLEVKDWKLETLRNLTKHTVDLLLDSGRVTTQPNPLEQARAYAHATVDVLSRDPALCHSAGPHRGHLSFPWGCGVVLANITRKQLDEALDENEQELVLPAHRVICKDDMTESIDAMEFQQRLWGMFEYQFGQPLTLPQIGRIRWHLFPEVRINAVEGDFFARTTVPNDRAAEIPEIVKVMDLQQETLARSLGHGHRVIHGVAGSGKTLILGYRCLHLAETAQKPILVLCFNITLAARLRSFAQEHGIADKVHVYHFHAWCKTQLQTYHVQVTDTDAPVWERQVEAVISGVEAGRIPRAQYDAIMIDEGHDFAPEWLKLIVQMVDQTSDSLLLLYDDAQAIYQKSNALKFSLSSVGIKAPGRTTILRLNYRNTREILEFAYKVVREFISPEAADDDHIPRIEPTAAGGSGPKPIFRRRENVESEIDYVIRCVQKWHDAGESLNEIAIICASGFHGRVVQERLEREKLPYLWMASHHTKSAYDPAQDQLSILSIQSSKGLEFKSVVFIGLGHLSDDRDEGERARLLYVGMTRACQRLILTASADNRITDRLAEMAA